MKHCLRLITVGLFLFGQARADIRPGLPLLPGPRGGFHDLAADLKEARRAEPPHWAAIIAYKVSTIKHAIVLFPNRDEAVLQATDLARILKQRVAAGNIPPEALVTVKSIIEAATQIAMRPRRELRDNYDIFITKVQSGWETGVIPRGPTPVGELVPKAGH